MTEAEHIAVLTAEIKRLKLVAARRESQYSRLLDTVVLSDVENSIEALPSAIKQLASRDVN